MHIEHWDIDEGLRKEARDNYRTAFALSLAGKDALTIIRELTFDGAAPSITAEDLQDLLAWIERKLLKKRFSGVGVEVGAGPLVFSSVLARFEDVKKMYGIEICQPIVEELFPGVAQGIAGRNSDKLVGVVGSFDEMKLPDRSVDFVFDFFSLHHSLDISVTFREIARVLKPGGFLLMLDKARPDSYSDLELDELLDTHYGLEYNQQFGLPEDSSITRRMNGEREYRLRDWSATAKSVGLSRFDSWHLEKSTTRGISGLVKKLVSYLPPRLQIIVSRALPLRKPSHKFVLETSRRIFTPLLKNFRKEMSVMVAYKS